MITASPSSILSLRLRSNLLTAPAASALDAARHLCGVQAQDPLAATLSLRPRTLDVTAAHVERARTEDRTLVRTWLMRSTLHLVAAEDLPLLLPLFGPPAAASNARRRAQLGLDPDTTTRATRLLQYFLASRGPQTRAQIAAFLQSRDLPHQGQATVHLIAYAAQHGILCYGPGEGRSGTDHTFVLLRDWLPPPVLKALDRPPDRNGALKTLARRYIAAYAPAAPEDFAYWSGLSLKDARAAWPNSPPQPTSPVPAEPPLHLLPAFDTYLLGYRSRALVVPEAHAAKVHPGGGIIHPTVIHNGRAIATWRHPRTRTGVQVTVHPFAPLPPAILPLLEAEVQDLSRFLALPVAAALY